MEECVQGDELAFFAEMPSMLPVYWALRARLYDELPDTVIDVRKTQISLKCPRIYATVSFLRARGVPKEHLTVSIGRAHRREAPRTAVAVEPYPGRWTNHVCLLSEAEVDDELMGWLREAYVFAREKQAG